MKELGKVTNWYKFGIALDIMCVGGRPGINSQVQPKYRDRGIEDCHVPAVA